MALNMFKLCSGLRVLGYLMILFVLAIIGISYYAVNFVTWGPKLFHGGLMAILALAIIILFHILLILLTWSYFMVVFRDPGSVPENYGSALDLLEMGTSTSLLDCAAPGARVSGQEGIQRRLAIEYCARCQNCKPPRCHHCSVCQRCVLKMDHHCVWVVNCVGARNYKFFLLFLLYTFLETTLDTVVLLPHFIKFFGEAKNHSTSPGDLGITVLAFVINLAFALSLICFLVMHSSLLSSNTTTIEVYEKKRVERWKYDLGRTRNFEQVFGTKKALWFFPLFAKEDLENIPALQGLDFPIRQDADT